MEYLNVDFKMMLSIYFILCQDESYNNPCFDFSKTHYSIIPKFHHSNFGEALIPGFWMTSIFVVFL